MQGRLAEVLLYRGRWNEAAEMAMSVITYSEASPLTRFPAVIALARLRQRRGDPAVEPLRVELSDFIQRVEEFQRLAPYACLKVGQAWLTGDDSAPVEPYRTGENVGRPDCTK
jgi:hypothetical protein